MYNYQNKLKNQKFFLFTQIKLKNQFLYFYKYNDMDSIEIINLKKFLKQNKMSFIILKQSLLKFYYPLKGQGPILIIYFNDKNNLKTLYNFNKNNLKIKPLFLIYKGVKISILKLLNLYKTEIPISLQIQKPLFNFYKTLLLIN